MTIAIIRFHVVAQYQFTMNQVSAAEGTPTIDVCVELVGSRPSTAVTLSLDPSPGTAESKALFRNGNS
jgi:hypothetical protein